MRFKKSGNLLRLEAGNTKTNPEQKRDQSILFESDIW